MSTAPLPPNHAPLTPPRRRRRWKRIAGWTLAAGFLLIAGMLIALVALFNNHSFRQYLLQIAHQRVSEVIGTQVRMRDFSLHLSGLSPSVDMYDVVIDGAAPYQTPPLARIDHLSVGIRITSILQRQWYLNDIVIDHPVARIFVGQNGETNLPKSTAKDQSGTSIFDLGVRHLMLGRGEIYYNDRKSVIDADLHDFELQAGFNLLDKGYSGGLSYHDGKIQMQDLNPMVHSLEAEFDVTPDRLSVKRGTLSNGNSRIAFAATVEDYVNPRVEATYQATLDSGELGRILNQATLPVGIVQLVGSAQYQSEKERPLLQMLTLDGNLTSAALQIDTTTIRTQVRDLSARYAIVKGDLDVRDLKARVLGGRLAGSLKIRDVAESQVSELHADLRNLSLSGIQTLANSPELRRLKLGGTASAKIDATWRKSFSTLTARADATLKGTIAPSSNPANNSVPLESEIHVRYSAAAEEVSFTQSFLRLPSSSLTLNGAVKGQASLQVQFQSKDLHELETVAAVFSASAQPLDLYGTGSFTGTVRGSTTAPQIEGQLSAPSLKVRGTEWRALRASVDASPSHLTLRNGGVEPANNRGRIAFNANVGLDQWAFKETSPIQLDLDASQLNVVDLRNLAGSQAPVTGTLSAKVSLRGSQLNPEGQGSITLTDATVADEPIQSATLNFQGTGEAIRAKVGLRIPAGTAEGNVTYFPQRKGYDAELQATSIRLDQFQILRARNLQINGVLNLKAKGAGTFDDPQFQLTAAIPQLEIQNETITGLTLQADVAKQVATVALDSQTRNTFVKGNGKVNLTGDYYADATIDTSVITLQPIFAVYMPAQSANLTGQTEIHATLKGPLKDSSQIDAHLTIPTLTVAYQNRFELAAEMPIQMDYTRGVLTLQKTAIRGTGTNLQLQGTIPVTSSAPIALLAVGTIDLRLAQALAPDIESSGQLQFNIDGFGPRTSPNVQGEIKVVNAAFAGGDLPLGLSNGNGVMRVTTDRLEIEKFQGSVSGGTLTATGGISYRPSVQFNLAVAANGIRLLYPQGVREGIDTNLTMVGSPENAVLRGQVRLNELSFSPSFDLADIAGELSGTSTAPPTGFARNLQLDINVLSTNELNLASSKLSLQGAANLRVRGTAADPSILGRISLTGGDLIFRGNRYLLLPSTIDFINPYRIEPRVNLAVDTDIHQYNIHLLFRGPVDQIRTTYSSDPALPPADIINLLVFGKTTEAADANPTPGNLGAQSMIASTVSGQVTSRLEKIAGISHLSVDPVLGGNGQDTGARVTIQQRVTGNLFVTFSTDATSTQKEVIKLEYQASPKVSFSGVRDQNGGIAVDIRLRKTW